VECWYRVVGVVSGVVELCFSFVLLVALDMKESEDYYSELLIQHAGLGM
jgi:hypothetical protein